MEPQMDILGKALIDFQQGRYTEDIITHSSLAGEDVIPLPYLFRSYSEMPEIEQQALGKSRGSVLDIGCGAGSHSLHLQEKGLDVTAIDHSPGAVETCRARGVQTVILQEIEQLSGPTFDTLLLLMNGIGLAGTLEKLPAFLLHLQKLLKPKGQILLDSSDIIYMFDQDDDGGYWIPGTVDYYGEVRFQMEYQSQKGPEFPWLYVDFDTLGTVAQSVGLQTEKLVGGPHFDYLARLTLAPQ